MTCIAEDIKHLTLNGVLDAEGRRFHIAILNVMGDWPFIAKCGLLLRHFHHVAKCFIRKWSNFSFWFLNITFPDQFPSSSSHAIWFILSSPVVCLPRHAEPTAKAKPKAKGKARAERKGICHLCQADRPNFLWEDFSSENPAWVSSINSLPLPFLRRPPILDLHHNLEHEASFFAIDIFHSWHLGAGKVFMASNIVLATDHFEGSNIPDRFAALNENFQAFCKAKRKKPYLRQISKTTCNWMSTMDYPSGAWSKGHTTLILHQWFLDFCQKHPDALEGDQLLQKAFEAAFHMNAFLEGVYREDVWIESEKACRLADHGRQFLKKNDEAAREAHELGRPLYLFMPNLHRLDHVFRAMIFHGKRAPYILNPLIWGTQADEDFIGKPSRLSRRVGVRCVILRTLQRSLMASYAKYCEYGLIIRSSA